MDNIKNVAALNLVAGCTLIGLDVAAIREALEFIRSGEAPGQETPVRRPLIRR